MYFQEPPAGRAKVGEAPLQLLLPTLFLAAANIYFGIETSVPVGIAKAAAESLLGATTPHWQSLKMRSTLLPTCLGSPQVIHIMDPACG